MSRIGPLGSGTYACVVPTVLTDFWRWLTKYKGLSPWPTTVEGWLVGARSLQAHLQQSAIDVAEEIGAKDLAERMQAEPVSTFPASEYLAELNQRRQGAGDLAYKRAGRKLRE